MGDESYAGGKDGASVTGLSHGMVGGPGWAWFFGALVLAGIVLIVVVAVRALVGGIQRPARPAEHAPHATTAVHILTERHARGEIDTADFQERLRLLREE